MHWVKRGPEPARLAAISARYTPRWIAHYRDQTGARPRDSRWREFHLDLAAAFSGLCGYCEELCPGEIDHFRPKNRFPERVYAWSNWVFSCHRCNQLKGAAWPAGGHVDPCAKSQPARPEKFFTFDTVTGEIVPQPGLTPARSLKAQSMIENLGLNEGFHTEKRLQWLWAISEMLKAGLEVQDRVLRKLVARNTEFSSLARVFLAERGYSVEPD